MNAGAIIEEAETFVIKLPIESSIRQAAEGSLDFLCLDGRLSNLGWMEMSIVSGEQRHESD
jgi:hypothetical protein